MKKIFALFIMMAALFLPQSGAARQGFSLGLGPMGNIYVIDSVPILDPGIGGSMFFQYRFHDQVAFETTFFLTAQDGKTTPGGAVNDTGILLLGMPVADIKLFFLGGDRTFDPYISTGLGLYWLTEGSNNNSTGGLGLGTQIGLGFDYYLGDVVSLGFQGIFRSVPVITSLGTPNSTAIFPYSLMGNVAFHF